MIADQGNIPKQLVNVGQYYRRNEAINARTEMAVQSWGMVLEGVLDQVKDTSLDQVRICLNGHGNIYIQ